MNQDIADRLIRLPKKITKKCFSFPAAGGKIVLAVESVDGTEKFNLDINRGGSIRLFRPSRCTYQERHLPAVVLVRLDLDKNKPHKNPDGKVICGPHLHVYREGYADKWAYLLSELENSPFSDPADLEKTFVEFCAYCNIGGIPAMQRSL